MRAGERVVLVTGASRGIGRAIAGRFAEQDETVVVHYGSNESAAKATLDGLAGDGHLAVSADLADPDAVESLVQRVVAEYGRIDVLVNNAAIYDAHPVLSTGYAEWRASWRRTIDTNLIGPANLIHEVVPQMVAIVDVNGASYLRT